MFEGAEGVSLWNVVRNEQPAKSLTECRTALA